MLILSINNFENTMKKFFLMAAMTVAALTASAQTRFEPGTITLQPRLGGTGSEFVNAPDMSVNGHTVEADATEGNFTGIDLEYYLSNRLGIAAGLNYSGAGTGWKSFDYTSNNIKYEVKELAWKTDYINIPVTLNWYVLKGFALKTGLQLGFLVDADFYSRTKYSQNGTDYTLAEERSVKDDFNKFDIAIPIGLSYEFKFPIVIDLRFNIGLTKVNKNDTPDGKDYQNFQAALTLGYKYKL